MAHPRKTTALVEFCSKKGLPGIAGKDSKTLSVRFAGADLEMFEELTRRFPEASPSDLLRTGARLLHKESGAGG